MNKQWDVITVGEIYNDHVFSGLPRWPAPGEEIFTRNYLRELGGGAAITACGLARLGRKTAVLGVVGKQEAPWILRRLREFHVDAEGLLQLPGSSGVTVSISVGDERSFYSFAGANERLNPYLASQEVLDRLCRASHVHIAAPLQWQLARTLLPRLKSEGCTISLDPGWQPEWYLDPENLQTCREIDYFLPNHSEAEYLTGVRRPEEVLLGMERLGFTHVVVKLGAQGAAIRTGGRTYQAPAPSVSVVDTTGAGDAFDAGLIDAILDHAGPLEVIERGARCGALSTRSAGALRGLATRQEIESMYEQS